MMRLSDYAGDIKLFEPWAPDFSADDLDTFRRDGSAALNLALDFLLGEPDLKAYAASCPDNSAGRRGLLQALLTLRPPRPFTPAVLKALDLIFCAEAEDRARAGKTVSAAALDFKDGLACWRGDITLLQADAIVNAANSALLGCFEPFHRCIDNAIHSAAGPRLRDDCGIIMDKQSALEGTGLAKITRAYALPGRFVLHTVGPIVPDHQPDARQEALLRSCYTACLDCCAEANVMLAANAQDRISTVAFCCISTGVFGYPQELAARAALEAVRARLAGGGGFKVIFNVFSRKDEDIYRSLLA